MFYESLDNGGGHRLVGIEIVSNEAEPGREPRSHGSTDMRILAGATRGGSLFTDPGIHNHSTVDNAKIGSRPNTAPEQSSDVVWGNRHRRKYLGQKPFGLRHEKIRKVRNVHK